MKGKFLVVQYAGKPADPAQTAKKGYLKENLVYDEKVSLANKLRDKDFISATVVLDLENKKILRRIKPPRLKSFACSASAGMPYIVNIKHTFQQHCVA